MGLAFFWRMLAAAAAPLLSLETLWSIRPATLARVFEAYGAPSGVKLGKALDLALVEKALVRSAVSDALAERGAHIEALATTLGQTAIHQAAAVVATPHDTEWADAASPADLAALVVAHAASDATTAEIVELALERVAREFPPRTWYQFVAALGAWGAKTGRGNFARVRTFGDARKAHFEVAHGERASAAVVVDGGGPSMVQLRTIRSYLVTYEAPTRRLFVWSAQPETVLELVELFARAVVGDDAWFFSQAAVALEPLKAFAPAKKLPAVGAPFASASLIGMMWDTGLGHTISPRGDDAYEALAKHGLAIDGGAIRLATVRAQPAAAVRATRAADLSIRPPYTITCSSPELAPALLRYADKLALTRAAPSRRDLWGRAPFVDSPSGFSDWPDYEACVSAGILVATAPSRRAAHPKHPHAGRIAKLWPTRRPGTSYAIADDPLFAPFLVKDSELEAMAIDFGRYAELFAAECRLRDPGKALDHDGVIALGDWAPGAARVRFVLPTRALAKGAVARIRAEAHGAHVVALVPEGRSSGLIDVPLYGLSGPHRRALRDAVSALGVEDDVAPSAYVAEGTRLVLHEKRRETWLDGTRCTRMHDNHVRLLLAFARATQQTATSRELGKAIGDWSDDSAARRTVSSLPSAFRRSFDAVDEKAPSDIDRIVVKGKKKGVYRLDVTVEIV